MSEKGWNVFRIFIIDSLCDEEKVNAVKFK